MVQRFDVGARLSEMAVHNGVAYLAGQVPEDASQDIQGQTAQVLAAIDALLARAGSDKSRILMAQIYLADLADFAGMNQAWDAWGGRRQRAAACHRAGRAGQSRLEDRGRRHGCLLKWPVGPA